MPPRNSRQRARESIIVRQHRVVGAIRAHAISRGNRRYSFAVRNSGLRGGVRGLPATISAIHARRASSVVRNTGRNFSSACPGACLCTERRATSKTLQHGEGRAGSRLSEEIINENAYHCQRRSRSARQVRLFRQSSEVRYRAAAILSSATPIWLSKRAAEILAD